MGATAGLELAQWVCDFINQPGLGDRGLEYTARTEALWAYFLRHFDIESADEHWRKAANMASEISLRESADTYRKGVFLFTDAEEWSEARRLVQEARRLHRLADIKGQAVLDKERYLGAVDVAEMYVEISAIYQGALADFEAGIHAGRRLLESAVPKDTPRTWLCGTNNFLALAVCGWRLGLDVLHPEEVVRTAESLLASQARPQNVLSVYLRWLWSLAVGEQEGLSRRVRRRLAGVRGALIADGRYLEAVRVLLDAAWIDAYRGRYRPLKERWSEQATDLLRLGSQAGIDAKVLGHWDRACAEGRIPSELAENVFRDLRGLPPGIRYPSIALY